MGSNWRYLRPHRGDLTFSSFVFESRSCSFHHPPPTPLRGRAPSRPGFSRWDYPRTMRETTRPELEPEEHLPLLALLERYIYPCWLSLTNGDPAHEHGNHVNEASNQSVQPLWVIEKPEDGGLCAHRKPSDHPNRSGGSHESLAKTKTIHMKLSLHLSFQLCRNIEGYMLGTTRSDI
jgi:hypothetical protein